MAQLTEQKQELHPTLTNEEASRQIEHLQRRNGEIITAHDEVLAEKASLIQKVASLEVKVTQLESKNNHLHKQCADNRTTHQKELMDSALHWQSQVSKLELEVASFKAKAEETDDERLNRANDEVRRLNQWNQQLEDANETLQKEVADAKEGSHTMQIVDESIVARNNELAGQNAELEKQVATLEAEKAEAEKEAGKWRRQHRHEAQRNSENWEARLKLEKRVAELGNQRDEARAEKDGLESNEARLDEEITTLKKRVFELEADNERLRADIGSFECCTEQLRHDANEWRARAETEHPSAAEAWQDADSARAENKKLRITNGELAERIEEQKQKLKELERDYDAIKSRTKLTQEIGQLKKRVQELTNGNTILHNLNVKLTNQLAESESVDSVGESSNLKRDVADARDTLKQLDTERESARIAELESEVEKLTKENSQFKIKVSHRESVIRVRDKRIWEVTDERARTQQALDNANAHIRRLEEQLAEPATEVEKELRERCEDLRKQWNIATRANEGYLDDIDALNTLVTKLTMERDEARGLQKFEEFVEGMRSQLEESVKNAEKRIEETVAKYAE